MYKPHKRKLFVILKTDKQIIKQPRKKRKGKITKDKLKKQITGENSGRETKKVYIKKLSRK